MTEPLPVVTTRSLDPMVPAGVTTLSSVGETTVKDVTEAPPIVTPVVPARNRPDTVIDFPPAVPPKSSATAVTMGPGVRTARMP